MSAQPASPSKATSSPEKKNIYRLTCCLFLQGHCSLGAAQCPYEHSDMTAKPCQYLEKCEKNHYYRNWERDEDFEYCTCCQKKFSIFTMKFRHHCRLCGKCVCGDCLLRDGGGLAPFPICTGCFKK